MGDYFEGGDHLLVLLAHEAVGEVDVPQGQVLLEQQGELSGGCLPDEVVVDVQRRQALAVLAQVQEELPQPAFLEGVLVDEQLFQFGDVGEAPGETGDAGVLHPVPADGEDPEFGSALESLRDVRHSQRAQSAVADEQHLQTGGLGEEVQEVLRPVDVDCVVADVESLQAGVGEAVADREDGLRHLCLAAGHEDVVDVEVLSGAAATLRLWALLRSCPKL